MFSNRGVHGCRAADPPLSLVLLEISPTAPEPEAPPEQRATWPPVSYYQIKREYKPLHASALFRRGNQAKRSSFMTNRESCCLCYLEFPGRRALRLYESEKEKKNALRLKNFISKSFFLLLRLFFHSSKNVLIEFLKMRFMKNENQCKFVQVM